MLHSKKILSILMAVMLVLGSTMTPVAAAKDFTYEIITKFRIIDTYTPLSDNTLYVELLDEKDTPTSGFLNPVTGDFNAFPKFELFREIDGTYFAWREEPFTYIDKNTSAKVTDNRYVYYTINPDTGVINPIRFTPHPQGKYAYAVTNEKPGADGKITLTSYNSGMLIDPLDDIFVTNIGLFTKNGQEIVLPKETLKKFGGRYVHFDYYEPASNGIRAYVFSENTSLMYLNDTTVYYLDTEGNIIYYYDENYNKVTTAYADAWFAKHPSDSRPGISYDETSETIEQLVLRTTLEERLLKDGLSLQNYYLSEDKKSVTCIATDENYDYYLLKLGPDFKMPTVPSIHCEITAEFDSCYTSREISVKYIEIKQDSETKILNLVTGEIISIPGFIIDAITSDAAFVRRLEEYSYSHPTTGEACKDNCYFYYFYDFETGKLTPATYYSNTLHQQISKRAPFPYEETGMQLKCFGTQTYTDLGNTTIYGNTIVTSYGLFSAKAGGEIRFPEEIRELMNDSFYVSYNTSHSQYGIEARFMTTNGIFTYYLDEDGNIAYTVENGEYIPTQYAREEPKPTIERKAVSEVTIKLLKNMGYDYDSCYYSETENTEVYILKKDGKMCTAKVTEIPSFSDVSSEAYYAQPVAWAVANGITIGTGADTFSPENKCTRAQILTFLYRAAGSPVIQDISSVYNLVTKEDYFYKPIMWAMSCGIISDDPSFDPHVPCTRQEAVEYMWAYEGRPESSAKLPFTDVKAEPEIIQAVAWALENGVTAGTSATTFSPANICTRSQIVTFLYRAFGK